MNLIKMIHQTESLFMLTKQSVSSESLTFNFLNLNGSSDDDDDDDDDDDSVVVNA